MRFAYILFFFAVIAFVDAALHGAGRLLSRLFGGQPEAQPGGTQNSLEALASPGSGKYGAVGQIGKLVPAKDMLRIPSAL